MKAYLSIRTTVSFFIALMIGAYSTGIIVNGSSTQVVSLPQTLSPELYNSAFSPKGSAGGKIIPASCSIGYPSDADDGFVACPVPSVTISPGSAVTLIGGGNLNWSYDSQNAAFCDFNTTMSSANLGPSYYYVEDPDKTFTNFGPFSNATGWVRYTIQCWDAGRTVSDTESITINLARQPDVDVVFGSSNPFLAINSFSGIDIDYRTGRLSWSVNGATSCSATGPSGWNGAAIALPNFSKIVYYSGTYEITRRYTLTCTNGTDTVARTASIYFEGSGGGMAR